MQRLTCILAAALMCNLMPAAQGGSIGGTMSRAQIPMRPVQRSVSAVQTAALSQHGPVVTRGQIAVCANLAAIRALGAKAAGSDYPTQSRVLDLTFVLCLAGSPAES